MKDIINKIGPNNFFIIVTIVISVAVLGGLVLLRGEGPSATEEDYLEIARNLGMDENAYLEALRSDEVRQTVESHQSEGRQKGITGTPTILLDGENINPSSNYDEFKKVIDAAIENSDDGKIVMEVYEDYQCPFCSEFFPVKYRIAAEYKDTVEVVSKHFPLESIHPSAKSLAIAAEAARSQGRFYDFSREIFEREHNKTFSELEGIVVNE